MKRRQVIFVTFSICFGLAVFLSLFSQKGNGGVGMGMQFLFAPLQKMIFQTSQSLHMPATIDEFREENTKLHAQIAQQQLTAQDNKAFRDQFQTSTPSPQSLLPARIVSMPSFFPGVSAPEELVIDKGKKDGVTAGMVVVVKDTLVGKIAKSNDHFSLVTLLGNKQTSFTAQTAQTGALGIGKGMGNGQLIIDNVVLSDSLKVGDIVVTKGDVSLDGKGYPPGLLVGKITSIEKNPSSLFQKGNVKSMVDVTKNSLIFVMVNR